MVLDFPIKRTVPWNCRKEWQDVYSSAYSNDPERQQFAVDRLLIWKTRSYEHLSLAPELTWMLLSLKLVDGKNEETKFVDCDKIRNLYGIAIIRFVNYTLETYQNAKTLISLKHLAQKVGLPQWILDLRHALTYEALPELNILREATAQALTFLENNYWMPQANYIITDESECKKKCKSLVDEYLQLIKQIPSGKKLTSEAKFKFQELELYVQANCQMFVQTLSENEKLVFVSTSKGIDNVLKIPKDVSKEWKPIHDQLFEWRLVNEFLDELLARLTEVGSDRDRSVLAWICFICNEGGQIKQIEATKLNFDSKKILLSVMNKPNKFTPFFVDKFCGLFPEIFKHRNQMFSLLKACGIRHPWQGDCMNLSALKEKSDKNAKEMQVHRMENKISFDSNCAITKIESADWHKIQCSGNCYKPQASLTRLQTKQPETVHESEFNSKVREHQLDWTIWSYDENLSIAQELTLQLSSLKILDIKNEGNNFLCGYQMRLLYGMHIIRFVEMTLKSYKSRKMSSEQISKKAGLPQWVIDLRHESAHQTLPELFLFRAAVDFALKFLMINYWVPHSFYGRVTNQSQVIPSFEEFFQLIKQKQSGDVTSKLQQLQKYVQANCKSLIEILIEDQSLMLPLFKSGDHDVLRIPENIIDDWTPMIDQLIEWNLIHGFLDKLLSKLTEVGSEQDRSILAWTCSICSEFGQKKQKAATKANFDAKKILYLGTIKPNKLTPFFVDKFCNMIPEVTEYRFNLLSFLNAYGLNHPWKDYCIDLKALLDKLNWSNPDINMDNISSSDKRELSVKPIIEKILTNENDGLEWFKYPLGVNPLGYFGLIFKGDEHTINGTDTNQDESMDYSEEQFESC